MPRGKYARETAEIGTTISSRKLLNSFGGIVTDLLLPSGLTIAQEMAPQIDAAFKDGKMPKQLLSGL